MHPPARLPSTHATAATPPAVSTAAVQPMLQGHSAGPVPVALAAAATPFSTMLYGAFSAPSPALVGVLPEHMPRKEEAPLADAVPAAVQSTGAFSSAAAAATAAPAAVPRPQPGFSHRTPAPMHVVSSIRRGGGSSGGTSVGTGRPAGRASAAAARLPQQRQQQPAAVAPTLPTDFEGWHYERAQHKWSYTYPCVTEQQRALAGEHTSAVGLVTCLVHSTCFAWCCFSIT